VSRYDLFRRRIAPIAFFLAIVLIARDSCEKNKRVHTTVELELGDARPQVRAVDVNVMVGGDVASTFHRIALPDSVIGPCRFELALADDDGELQIDVDLGGDHRRLTRKFHLIEGSTMQVSLGGDLQPRR
jgi:hypothetical protein